MYWLLVGLVRSLKSSHKEALRKLLLCEDYNDLTSPYNNQIPCIHIAFLLYTTLFKILLGAFLFKLFNPSFNCEMKLGVLLKYT